MKECGKEAKFLIAWGSQELYQCEEHTKLILSVGEEMGFKPACFGYVGNKICSQKVKEEG